MFHKEMESKLCKGQNFNQCLDEQSFKCRKMEEKQDLKALIINVFKSQKYFELSKTERNMLAF